MRKNAALRDREHREIAGSVNAKYVYTYVYASAKMLPWLRLKQPCQNFLPQLSNSTTTVIRSAAEGVMC